MLTRLLAIFACVLVGWVNSGFAQNVSSDSPIGYWRTMDDVTGKPKSIIQIWRTSDQQLMGKVIKVYSKQAKLCTACAGQQHNQPLVGMVILSGLSSEQPLWNKGKIFDSDNGKTYKCSVHVTENGKRLNVHDYIGLPLFGRSQTWERVDLMSG